MHLFASAKHAFLLFLCVVTLAACSTGGPQGASDGVDDPFEAQNRKVHAFNRGLDRALVRPAGKGYTTIVPDDIEDSVGNFAENLDRPSYVLNAILQGDLRGATVSTGRFLINSTLGFAGLFDVASDFNIDEHETDFGETLHIWGVGEGAYLELPLLGPSTQRDAVGIVVDFFSNPLRYTLDAPEENYSSIAGGASRLGDRGRFSDTIDSILYESADSYAQARLIYLQNRRFELGDDASAAGTEIDPFALDTEGF